VFTELTYHAAYEPQRAIRTERFKYIRRFGDDLRPVLANVDDSPTKDVLSTLGWFDRPVEREQLFDLIADPNEMQNLAADPAYAATHAELSARLDEWMRDTADPLLDGPVPAPRGARLNRPTDRSAEDQPVVA
jgi:N-sulfoglucosamine sulfohydrolase